MIRYLFALFLCIALNCEAAEPKVAILDVTGMACMICAAKVKKTLERLPGVLEAKADAKTNRAEVKYDPEKLNPETLAKTVTDAGFKAAPRP